jgi:hypothetical protein
MHEVPQAPPERADDRLRDVGLMAVEILEVSARKKDEPRVLCGHRRGRIRAAVEQRQFRHRAPWPLDVQHLLAPRLIRAVDAHAAGFDHVETAALFSGREQHVSGEDRP